MKLRQVTIPRRGGEYEYYFFILSNCVLLLTCFIIVGAISGLIYFVYVAFFRQEQYMQFIDEQQMKPFKNLTIDDLKKIEEQINYARMSQSTVGKEVDPEIIKKLEFIRS